MARYWVVLAILAVLASVGIAFAVAASPAQASAPIRAAFYYPWFPEAWNQAGINPYTKYHPSLGFYDGSSDAVIKQQISAMQYGKIDVGIASWWGQGTKTDSRIPLLLKDAAGTGFKWTLYYEPEGTSDPTVAQIQSDLTYIRDHYAVDPSYLTVNGKPVIFVYAGGNDGAGMAARWKAANTLGFYVVLKVYHGYKTDPNQPDSWHQYAPAVATDSQGAFSYAISPGFNKAGEATPRLARDLTRWQANIASMVASGAQWQLITTFNEWGEGSSVESATEWATPSGFGAYLDALHNDGQAPPAPDVCTREVTTAAYTVTTRDLRNGVAYSTSTQTVPQDVKTTTIDCPATTPPPPPPPPPPPSGSDPVIVAAGDIACPPGSKITATTCRQGPVASMFSAINPAAILTLGDNQYESNTLAEYTGTGSFNDTWGKFKPLIRPGIGNHEYLTANAAGYFSYFGSIAGSAAKPYYSYDVGTWHFISLNDECSRVPGGGCSATSDQAAWLKADLAAHPAACTLAYWHEPRFSSGEHGSAKQGAALWNILADAHADIFLAGHNHDYERFQPSGNTPATSSVPTLDPNGIRSFVVGTGGKNHYGFGSVAPLAGEVVRNADTYGVLKLTLHPNGYDWQFVNDPGSGSFTDSGSGSCH